MRKATLQLTGQRFGKLTVVAKAERPSYWICSCACGGTSTVRGTRLVQGITASCGCSRKSHGHTIGGKPSPTYLSWTSMKQRCNNSASSAYGGRGIRYDPAWEHFDNFLTDMHERPAEMTLDRIDPMRHYFKGNCRWASDTTQANNKRDTKTLYFNFEHYGKEGSPAEWARWLRTQTGNTKWTVRQLHNCLRTLTLDQIICAVHPAALNPPELLERHRLAQQSEEQRAVDTILSNLLAACP